MKDLVLFFIFFIAPIIFLVKIFEREKPFVKPIYISEQRSAISDYIEKINHEINEERKKNNPRHKSVDIFLDVEQQVYPGLFNPRETSETDIIDEDIEVHE